MLKKYIICDIDGTLARKYEGRGIHDYDLVSKDTPIKETIKLISDFVFSNCTNHEIIFITGRPEKCREDTNNWLSIKVTRSPIIYMRQDGDYRQSNIVKKELLYKCYQDLGITKDNIFCVFEDRLQDVKMWAEEGLFVFDVGQGKGDF